MRVFGQLFANVVANDADRPTTTSDLFDAKKGANTVVHADRPPLDSPEESTNHAVGRRTWFGGQEARAWREPQGSVKGCWEDASRELGAED